MEGLDGEIGLLLRWNMTACSVHDPGYGGARKTQEQYCLAFGQTVTDAAHCFHESQRSFSATGSTHDEAVPCCIKHGLALFAEREGHNSQPVMDF